MFVSSNFLLVASILLFVSIFAGKTGYRFGVPSLLLFLIVGMVFGSDGLGIEFNNFKETQFIGMIALTIILFSGGMNTNKNDIKPIVLPGILLSTIGVILTSLLVGLFVYYACGIPSGFRNFIGCLLLASVMSSTDSASVFSILRGKNLHINKQVRATLELESGSNDPMAYMLTIVLISYLQLSNLSIGVILWSLVIQFVLGIVLGYIIGRLAVFTLNKINLDNSSLYSILLLSFALFAFAFTDFMQGNGYLAVYIAGLVVGNNKVIYKKSFLVFFDGLAWLFQIIMFLTLGLLVNPTELLSIWPEALSICLFMIFIARPISVFACLAPFKNFTKNGKLFISWVGLRGAVPIIFAIYPYVAGIPFAKEIFNTVFFITIISLVVQGTSVPLFARKLNLVEKRTTHKDFSVDIPEDIALTSEVPITEELLSRAKTIADIEVNDKTIPIMIKRKGKYLLVKQDMKLEADDKLLLIAKDEEDLNNLCAKLNIKNCEIYKE